LNTLLKKFFFVPNLAAVALCAYLTASTVNNFVAAAIDPDAGATKTKRKGRSNHQPKQTAESEWKNNPFCPTCTPPVPVNHAAAELPPIQDDVPEETVPVGSCPKRSKLVQFSREVLLYEAKKKLSGEETSGTGPPPEPPSLPGVERSGLDVTLISTLVASSPEFSLATFEEGGERRFYRGRDDDLVKGEARVEQILRKHVFLVRNGQCEYVNLSKEKGRRRTARVAKKEALKPGKGIKKVGDGEYLVDRAEIENTLANLNKVATDARIVPSFKDGKGNGFKLFSIRPGSIYSRIGVQNGDIIQKINGFDMDSPEKALEVYQKLQDAEHVKIDLLRRGKSKSMEYTIQ